jgi:predicted outer membrane protein
MRSCWMLAAAGLLLAACRTDGDRGEAAPQDRGATLPNKVGQVERALTGPSTDEASTARLLAATRAVAQAEVEAGKLAQQRATTAEVKDYATRAVAELQADLDALTDLLKAKKIDIDAPVVVNDPLLRAEKDALKEGIDRLRALSGTAFDATYLTGQRPSRALLGQLATQAPPASRDPEVGNVLRTMAQQAREQTTRALVILPKACGGERPGWGGAG